MTIQIQLPDTTLAALISQAQAEGRSAEELAATTLSELFTVNGDTQTLTGDNAMQRLGQGFADLDAGRTLSVAEAQMALHTAFNDRYETPPQAES